MPLRTDFHGVFRFKVTIDNLHVANFTEFQMPNLQVETQDIKEGGQNAFVHKLPVRVTVGSATLRHGISDSLDLLKWYLQVLNGDMENARRQISVIFYEDEHKPIITWTFRDAYPVKWAGPSLKSDQNAVAIEELEFVHHGFEIE